MDTLLSILQDRVSQAIGNAFGELLSKNEQAADISVCAQENFGHYQCNSALRLSKPLKQSPRQIAEKILSHFDSTICDKIDIAGPGFINFILSPQFLSKELQKQLHDPYLGASFSKKKKKVLVEFSSPNVAKELHVGHLRSTIIGDCIARLFEFLGEDVLRLNHIGDWGTQFGMLITYLKEYNLKFLKGEEDASLELLMAWYRSAKKCFDQDLDFKKRAQLEVVRLQSKDPETIDIWKRICHISRLGFQEIYDLLDVQIQERGESFYNPYLESIVEELSAKNLVTVSDGAKCVFLEGFKNRDGDPMPVIIQKSDGGYNYDTTDLAALRHRIQVEKADRIIILTDLGQSLHFQMIFAIAEKAGWLNNQVTELEHIGFGLVLGPDGKKFKTRSGDTEKLLDLLTEAIDRARSIIQERTPEISKKELEKLARVIGIGAVKYADLSSHRTKDYTFSYERMLRFDGNTAVFLLYAYVRMQGIKRKVKISEEKILSDYEIALQHPTEISLALHLRRFGEILELVAQDLLPNRLTDYLYTLAEKFNAFFRDCRVEGVSEQKSRLALVTLTSKVLKQGLEILGLKTVDKM